MRKELDATISKSRYLDLNGFYHQLKYEKCFILLINFVWIDKGWIKICQKLWEPPSRKSHQNNQKKTSHLQKHAISEGKQFRICGLRHCIAFEKPFNLVMNFNWIEKRQYGLYKKNMSINIVIQYQSSSYTVQLFVN